MNATAAGAHRARVTASAFLLDVPLIGVAEAVERVLGHWQDGARLSELPCGSWLLQLAEPVELRADHGPGLPLLARGGALVAFDAQDEPAETGQLVRRRGGTVERHGLAGLRRLRPAEWLNLEVLTIRQLAVLDATPDPQPPLDAVLERPRPDLRATAGVRPASPRLRRTLARGPRAGVLATTLGVLRTALPFVPALALLGRFGWLCTTIGPVAAAPLLMLVAVVALAGAVFGIGGGAAAATS
ncbi:bpX6 domain-containing protein, partial [Kitasatospora sp. LaBMicrA B282]|uniref:bpX6 domain-containing protein n=1 Tax=Kitasatospora sp. LaBMicrA B282 TaxID=3420949 RepID=UPI003D11A8D0